MKTLYHTAPHMKTLNLTFSLSLKSLLLTATLLLTCVGEVWGTDLYVRGVRNGWNTSEKMEGTSSPWTYSAYWSTNNEFKIADNSWGSINLGSASIKKWGTEYNMTNNGSNMTFPSLPADGGRYKITVTLENSSYYIKVDKEVEEGETAYNISNSPYIYFNVINASSTYTKASILLGKSDGSQDYAMSGKISNTELFYKQMPDWSGYKTFLFIDANNWGGSWSGEKVTQRIGGAINSNSNNVSLNGGYHMFSIANGDDNAALSYTSENTYAALLNKTQTIQVRISEDNGSSYTNAANFGAWPGTINVTRTYLSSATASSSPSATAMTTNTTQGALTSMITFTGANTTEYTFAGWSDTNNSPDGETSKTYIISDAATKYAFYKRKQYAVTFDAKGDCGTSIVTATAGGIAATSGNNYNHGSTIVFTAAPAAGYMIEGWYSDAACTVSLGNGTNTTYTINSLTAGSMVYCKFIPITITDVTVSPSSGGTGNQTMTVSFKTNAPRNSGYYYRIAEFGGVNSGTKGGGFYINGVVIGTDNTGDASTLITVSPFTPNFGTSGVYTAAIEIYTDGPITVQKTYNFTYGAGNYYTVSFNMNGHGSSISSQSVLSGATATRPSPDPTATGYTFGGWYQEAACTNVWNFGTAITAARALFAKWTPKTTTITLDRQSGTGGSSSVTATYDAAMPSATMPKRTNYTFAGYWSGENGTGTKYYNADGSSAHTWNYEDATKNLYAYWTENTYTVNVSCSNPAATSGAIAYNGGALPAGGNIQVGAVTAVSLTASDAINTGYKRGSWVLTDGVRLASGTLSDLSISITATAAGTATYTYDEDLSTGWYLRTDINGDLDGNRNSAEYEFKKPAGQSTGNIAELTLSLSNVGSYLKSDYKLRFKLHNGSNLYGDTNSGTMTKTNCTDWTMVNADSKDVTNLEVSLTGDYTFRFNTSTKKLTIIYPIVNQLQIYDTWKLGGGDADNSKVNNYNWDSQTGTIYTKTLSLAANQGYKFKVVYNSDFYGFKTGSPESGNNNPSNPMRSNACSNWRLYTDGGDCYIETTVAGDYVFSFNTNNSGITTLSVQYPQGKTLSCDNNSWDQTANNYNSNAGNNYTWNLTLAADHLEEFKIIDNGIWYGSSTGDGIVLTTTANSGTLIASGGYNAKIATTVAGTYTVTYNASTHAISVTYPTPAVPAMTGTLTGVWSPLKGLGNGTNVSPYEVFKGTEISHFKFTHASQPTVDEHFRYRFYLDDVLVQGPYGATTAYYMYSNGAENTLGDHVVRLEVYYEYGPEGYKTEGTALISNIYYKVVESPVATITSDYSDVEINQSFTLSASLSRTDIIKSGNSYIFYKDGTAQTARAEAYLSQSYSEGGSHTYYVKIKDRWDTEWQSEPIIVQVYNPANSIVVRFNISEVVDAATATKWGDGLKVHYWGTDLSSEGVNKDAVLEGDDWYSVVIPLCSDGKVSFQAVSKKTETSGYGSYNDLRTTNILDVKESGCYIVKNSQYTGGGEHNKKRLWEKTEDCQLYYAVQSVVGTDTYFSNRVHKNGAALSFYANKAGTLNLVRHNNGEGWETIKPLTPSFSKDSVYTSTFVKKTLGIGPMVAYSGAYYLYSPAVAVGKEHNMDSTFIHFDGNEAYTANPYNYYWVDWFTANANVSATIGNHINNNLAQAITNEGGFTDSKVPAGGANVRFAYNPKTNYFSRSAIGPAGDLTKRFLMLYDKGGLTKFKRVYETDGTLIANPTDYDAITSNAATDYYRNAVFNDDGNWVYEIDVKATSASRVIAHSLFNGSDYYLFGMDGENPKAVQLHTAEGTLTMRVIYDFKTNRIVAGWVPDDNYNGTIDLNSAVIFLREANNDSKQVKLTGNNKVTNITQVYTVLELRSSNWNTTGRFFWFSLPYSCKIADMFGLGEYGIDWVIQRYRGDLRAQNGWFKESPTFWRNLKKTATLEANRGYVVYLTERPTFKSDGVARLYFPSDVSKWEFEPKAVTTTLPYNECTICQGCEQDASRKGNKNYDRTKEDSHWYVAGVPAFQNCTISAHSATIKNDNVLNMSRENPLYYYEWNYNDGSPTYTPRSSVGTEFKSTFAYMFQYAGNITWVSSTGISASTPSGIAARRVADEEGVVEEMTLQLTNGEDVFDHTYITLNDIATSDYDLNLDLSKIMNDGPQIYSLVGSYNMAANQLPHSATEVPLGIVFPETGEYQLSLAKGMPAGKSVSIYDAAESREYSLENPVTIYADSAHTSVGRYYVRIQKKQGQITTAADNTLSGTISVTQADGRLFISGIEGRAEAMLYDMTGKLLYRTMVESGEGIAAPQQGIYLMRVAGQTLKINVR